MPSYVLWAIDSEIEPNQFERLCVDLLSREGYPQIIPVGGSQDRGRDAEMSTGTSDRAGTTFFQFSLQADWERKLREELDKVRANAHEITDFVFVTSRSVSGAARDRWVARTREDYGWRLRIFEREWLRNRLEEAHSDLADRYLGRAPTTPPDQPHVAAPTARASGLAGQESPWLLTEAGRHQEAIAAFHRLLENNPRRADTWAGLAWAAYQLFHYDDAIAASEQALLLEPDDRQWQSVRACILTEAGIHSGSRASVMEGAAIFSRLAADSARWVDHYNHANALAALGDHGSAVAAYRRALELDATHPEVWKNIGSSLHELGQHEEEMVCLDRALAIDPQQPQALVSKGVGVLVDQNDPGRAINLLEEARRVSPAFFRRWPSAWNWLARAYLANNDRQSALLRVREGIGAVPSDAQLRSLEGAILHHLWPENREFIPDAITANQFLQRMRPEEYGYAAELAALHHANGNDATALDALIAWYERQGLGSGAALRRLSLPVSAVRAALQFVPQYITFRRYRPAGEYFASADDGALSPANAAFAEPEILDALTAMFAFAFGVAFDAMRRADRRRPRATLLKAMREAKAVIVPAVAEACALVAELSDLDVRDMEGRVHLVVEGVVLAPLIGLRELGALVGWVIALTSMPLDEAAIDQVSHHLRYPDMQNALVEQTLTRMNDVLGLLPRA